MNKVLQPKNKDDKKIGEEQNEPVQELKNRMEVDNTKRQDEFMANKNIKENEVINYNNEVNEKEEIAGATKPFNSNETSKEDVLEDSKKDLDMQDENITSFNKSSKTSSEQNKEPEKKTLNKTQTPKKKQESSLYTDSILSQITNSQLQNVGNLIDELQHKLPNKKLN